MTYEQESPITPENGREVYPQNPAEGLISFAKYLLGFTETLRMQGLRQKIDSLDGHSVESEAEFKRNMLAYQDLAAKEIDKILDVEQYSDAQIGLVIASSAIYHSARKFSSYRAGMSDAIEYAHNMEYEDIVEGLRARQLEIFEGDFRRGFIELFSLLDAAPRGYLIVDPSLMDIDDRRIGELTVPERQLAHNVVYEELGLDSSHLAQAKVREYSVQADEIAKAFGGVEDVVLGGAEVSVFKTNREHQGVALHELTFSDGQKRWVIGSDQNMNF